MLSRSPLAPFQKSDRPEIVEISGRFALWVHDRRSQIFSARFSPRMPTKAPFSFWGESG